MKIDCTIADNIEKFFKNQEVMRTFPTSNHFSEKQMSEFLSYSRDNLNKLRSHCADLKLSTLQRFAVKMDLNLPVMFSTEFDAIVTDRYSLKVDDIHPDDDETIIDEKRRILQRRAFQCDDNLPQFIDNFSKNIRAILQKNHQKLVTLYQNEDREISGWPPDNERLSRRTVTKILSLTNRCENCNVSTLGWLALCTGYGWDDIGTLLCDPAILQFKDGKLVPKAGHENTFLLEPANIII